MRRRDLLGVTSTAVVSILSGCTSSTDSRSDDGSGGGSGNGDDESTSESIEQAIDYLEDAETEFEYDERSEFDDQRVTSRLGAARDELEDARDGATDDQLTFIEEIDLYADFLEAATEYEREVIALLDGIDTTFAYIQAERIENAQESLEDDRSTLDDVADHGKKINDLLDDLEETSLEDEAPVAYQDRRRKYADVDEAVDAFRMFLDGFGLYLDGTEYAYEGDRDYNNGRLRSAASSYERSASEFEDARSEFEDAEDAYDDDYRQFMIEMECTADAMSEALQHLANAVNAEADGDREKAQKEAERATEAFQTTCV